MWIKIFKRFKTWHESYCQLKYSRRSQVWHRALIWMTASIFFQPRPNSFTQKSSSVKAGPSCTSAKINKFSYAWYRSMLLKKTPYRQQVLFHIKITLENGGSWFMRSLLFSTLICSNHKFFSSLSAAFVRYNCILTVDQNYNISKTLYQVKCILVITREEPFGISSTKVDIYKRPVQQIGIIFNIIFLVTQFPWK